MPEYHIYCIDEKNQILSRHDFIGRDDLAALEKGQELCGECEVEAWQGTRFVARLAKDGTASVQPLRGLRTA